MQPKLAATGRQPCFQQLATLFLRSLFTTVGNSIDSRAVQKTASESRIPSRAVNECARLPHRRWPPLVYEVVLKLVFARARPRCVCLSIVASPLCHPVLWRPSSCPHRTVATHFGVHQPLLEGRWVCGPSGGSQLVFARACCGTEPGRSARLERAWARELVTWKEYPEKGWSAVSARLQGPEPRKG